jgi:hypothetical protein
MKQKEESDVGGDGEDTGKFCEVRGAVMKLGVD